MTVIEYPGPEMREWCAACVGLMEIVSPSRGFLTERSLARIAREAGPRGADGVVPALFWGAWIDQVLYYLLADRRFSRRRESGLYESFREAYPFPRLLDHSGYTFASPALALERPRPDQRLLEDTGRQFWYGEVSPWLVRRAGEKWDGEGLAGEAVELFRRDLLERFPPGLRGCLVF